MQRNLASIYSPFGSLSWRVFTYLRDVFINEFPWLISESKTFEILESKKNKASLSPKYIAADLLVFSIICAFLVIMIFLSSKCSKDEDIAEEENEEIDQIYADPTNNEMITESSTSSMYSIPLESMEYKENVPRCDCGDSSLIPRLEELPLINFNSRHYPQFNYNDDITEQTESTTSTISVREVMSYSSDRRQIQRKLSVVHSRVSKRANKQQGQPHVKMFENEWLIRRTRSGHVYGKYPL